jgi:hypothetical protein
MLIVLLSSVFLLCVVTFWVPCCAVCYDFRIKRMFGCSPPVVCKSVHVLLMLFWFICYRGVQHILCFFVFFHRLVYPMLLVSLDCPFLIALSVFSNVLLKQLWSSNQPISNKAKQSPTLSFLINGSHLNWIHWTQQKHHNRWR